jgi:F-type H+-transporting ATPase subunit b
LELSWSTFLLEIVNFLVLIWILKRFLYKPVLNVIARRRSGIENQIAEASHLHEEAENLKRDYENRLADGDRERQQALNALAREIDEERSRQMAALQTTLAQEREKAQVAESRRRAEAVRETEYQAMQQGAQFAGRLLSLAACPELETRFAELLLEDLSALSGERITALRAQWGQAPEAIRVASVFPLQPDLQQRLESALRDATGLDLPVTYEQDPGLMAGLLVTIGAWALQVNLRDELKGFVELAHAAR